jgi:hypothetical protein
MFCGVVPQMQTIVNIQFWTTGGSYITLWGLIFLSEFYLLHLSKYRAINVLISRHRARITCSITKSQATFYS